MAISVAGRYYFGMDEHVIDARTRRVEIAVERTQQFKAGCGFVMTPAQLLEYQRLQTEELLAAQCEAEA